MRGRTRRSTAAAAVLALLVAGAAGCGDDDEPGTTSATQVPATTTEVDGTADGTTEPDGDATGETPPEEIPRPQVEGAEVTALDSPIALLPRPGDDHLWAAERGGTVRRLAVGGDGTLEPAGDPVLDISDDTTTESERGLLGLAFSQDGATLYVSHTNGAGDTRLAAYDVADDGTVDAGSRRVLFEVDQPYANHNGGHVLLGPDGDLWFGLGDGGAADDPENRAQDPDDPLGKLLRIDAASGDAEIVVSGLRNPWRFDFDTDGSLWIADVGQNEVEEIDRLPAGSIEGANLGWSGFEGTRPYLDGAARRGEDPIPPVFEYTHADGGNCSITGGFVYRGVAMPDLVGAYLFADYCAGRVRAVRVDDDGALIAEHDLGIDVPGPISFGRDADGEPYVLSQRGPVVRVVPAG